MVSEEKNCWESFHLREKKYLSKKISKKKSFKLEKNVY